MPGYGQTTRIPVSRNGRETSAPQTATTGTRPSTASRPGNPLPSSATPRSRTFIKSKPGVIGSRPATQAGTSGAENYYSIPSTQELGAYGQRYASKVVNLSRPLTATTASAKRLMGTPGSVKTPLESRKPSKPQISRVQPKTSTLKSKKSAVRTDTPVQDVNSNPNNAEVKKEVIIQPTSSASSSQPKKSRKGSTTSVSRLAKKAPSRTSKDGEGDLALKGINQTETTPTIQEVSPTDGEKNEEAGRTIPELPKINLFDLNLSREVGPSVHIQSHIVAQTGLSMDKLPEYKVRHGGTTSKLVEMWNGISIEEMTPPPELHSVMSDPKLQDFMSLRSGSPPPESILDMEQPHLVASEENLQEMMPIQQESHPESSVVLADILPAAELASVIEEIVPDLPVEDTVEEPVPPPVEDEEPVPEEPTITPSAPPKEEIPSEENQQLEPLNPNDNFNIYELSPQQKQEYLGNVVHVPKVITLTKDNPPLYAGVFAIQNTSQEDLIFKVKTRTQSANIYAINPKIGTLGKASLVNVKIQADFSKTVFPSADMLKKNLVVFVAAAPPMQMTRKDLEKFWKLLQDQQDAGKSSFFVHSIESIQLVDKDSNFIPGTTAIIPLVKKPSPVAIPIEVVPVEAPEVLDPIDTSPTVTNAPENTAEPAFDDVYSSQMAAEVTQDVREMSGTMSSILRWGSISIYVSSIIGVGILVLQNIKDGNAAPDESGGFYNWISGVKKNP